MNIKELKNHNFKVKFLKVEIYYVTVGRRSACQTVSHYPVTRSIFKRPENIKKTKFTK